MHWALSPHPRGWFEGRARSFMRYSQVGGSWVTRSMGIWTLTPSFFSLPSNNQRGSCFLCHMLSPWCSLCITTGTKAVGQLIMVWGLGKCEPKSTSHLTIYFSRNLQQTQKGNAYIRPPEKSKHLSSFFLSLCLSISLCVSLCFFLPSSPLPL